MTTRARPRRVDPACGESASLRDTDYYTWCFEQAALLDANKRESIEPVNIADEISDIAAARYDELQEALTEALMLALIWDFGRRQGRVIERLDEQRHAITEMIEDAPSLGARAPEATDHAWDYARYRAADELDMDLDAFPPFCPWTFDNLMTREFFASTGNA